MQYPDSPATTSTRLDSPVGFAIDTYIDRLHLTATARGPNKSQFVQPMVHTRQDSFQAAMPNTGATPAAAAAAAAKMAVQVPSAEQKDMLDAPLVSSV